MTGIYIIGTCSLCNKIYGNIIDFVLKCLNDKSRGCWLL
eukprot:UN00381